MKQLLKVLLLMIYTFMVFFVSNYYILGLFGLGNSMVMKVARIPLKAAVKYVLALAPFMLFAAFINGILGDIQEGILIMIRLLIVCNITYSFKYMVSAMELAHAIEILLYPFKLVKVEPKDIGLMICICVAFLPILMRELRQIKSALQAKGMRLTIKNTKYVLKPFLYGILKRTDEITNALKAKGYT
jgi:energy-coupling factor transport system permease protein